MASLEIRGNNLEDFIPTIVRKTITQQLPLLGEQYKIGIYTGAEAEEKIVPVSALGVLGITTEAANDAGKMIGDIGKAVVIVSTETLKQYSQNTRGVSGLVAKSVGAGLEGTSQYLEDAPSISEWFTSPINSSVKNTKAIGAGVGRWYIALTR